MVVWSGRIGVAAMLIAATLIATFGFAGAKSGADLSIQKEAVLKRSDLPHGWSSERRTDDDLPAIPACADLDSVNDALRTLSTKSRDFLESDTTRAANSVVVLKSSKLAKSYVEPYRAPDASACLEALMKTAFASPRIANARVYVTPSDDAPRGADEAAALEIQMTITTAATAQQPAETRVLYYDLLVARVGRALTNFTFLDEGRPLPDQGEFVDVVIGRLQGAL